MTVTLRLRELREAKGRSQRDVAQAAGIPESNYSEIERGLTKQIAFATLAKLADALGVHARELIHDDAAR